MRNDISKLPGSGLVGKAGRAALQLGSSVPVLGGLLSASAGAWSEYEQEKVNSFFQSWLKMLQDEIMEKEQTVIEIMSRLDMQDEKITERLEGDAYQSLVKKAFRDWAGAESEKKREWIRNILANAAASEIVSDDVIRLFIEWLKKYSELHFLVIAAVYNTNGITRGQIWRKIGKSSVRDDSADADLFRLLIHDLSVGRIMRQHRQVNYQGQFMTKPAQKRTSSKAQGPRPMESAFDDEDQYELTELGKQFVHYAMTDLPLKIDVKSSVVPEQEPVDIAHEESSAASV